MDQSPSLSDAVDLARVARLVRPFETLELHAVRRPGGGWSIGYGHIRSAREGAEVTREEAEALLLYDLRHVAGVVRAAVYAPIQRNQLEALIAFAFHIGTDSFLRSTTLHRFNAGDSLGAAQEIEGWRCANLDGETQVVDALVRRRAAEKAHFLTPPEGFPKASRAHVRPQFEAWTAASVGEAADVEPSAALAAADTVAARLRALVPDVAEPVEPEASAIEPELEPEPVGAPACEPAAAAADAEPAPSAPETVAVAAAVEASGEPEAEIPPPPMPFEAALHAAKVEPAAFDPWPPARAESAAFDGWPPAPAHDPFGQVPLDTPSIQAAPLGVSPPVASLFRAKPEPAAKTRPRPQPARKAASRRTLWERAPQEAFWGCAALGLAMFLGAIGSILKTNPGPLNFGAGLVGIALMAVPAYFLFVAKPKSSPKKA